MSEEYKSYTELWIERYRNENPEKAREIEFRSCQPSYPLVANRNCETTAVQSIIPVYARAEDYLVPSGRIHPVVESAILIRKQLNLTQANFARCLNISARTLRDWEQGRRCPSGAALTLLKWATDQPDYICKNYTSMGTLR